MRKGTFCISIDTELLWGRRDLNYKSFEKRAKKVPDVISTLLKLFNKYDIPATWAVVGSLYLPNDKSEFGSKLWKSPEIINEITKYKNQEIGCHSYTHPEFTSISKEEADKELKNCLSLAQKHNIKLKSFVYPRNKINHKDILEKYGFTSYRGEEEAFVHLPKKIKKLVEIIDLFALIPHTAVPKKDNKLVNIPGSMYYVSARGIRKYIPSKIRIWKAKLGINKAIKNNELFHLWFHPIDLADKTEDLISGLEEIIKYADEKRTKNLLEIKTMKEIALEF